MVIPQLFLDGTELTEPELETWAEGIFKNTNAETAVLFATAELCAELDLLVGERVRALGTSQTYGLPATQIVTAHGTLTVIKVAGSGRVGLAFPGMIGVIR